MRVRDINPVGHTRSPRYVRGRRGTVERLCGIEPPWDTGAEGHRVSDKPQPVYSVRFTAHELWGEKRTTAIRSRSTCGKRTLSRRDAAMTAEELALLPRLPRDEEGPVFAEPWEASAFALAVRLSAQGHFTWNEWAATLGGELKAAAARGEPEDGSRYYHCWLAALERLVVAKHLSDATTLLARKEAWAEAYRRTPHDKPVELQDESNATLE